MTENGENLRETQYRGYISSEFVNRKKNYRGPKTLFRNPFKININGYLNDSRIIEPVFMSKSKFVQPILV